MALPPIEKEALVTSAPVQPALYSSRDASPYVDLLMRIS